MVIILRKSLGDTKMKSGALAVFRQQAFAILVSCVNFDHFFSVR